MAEGRKDSKEGPEKIDKQMICAVRRVLQEELHEIKDLLVCLMEKQRDIHERNQSEQCEPKLAQPSLPTPGNPRSAPRRLPRSFSNILSKPATIDKLEEELAEQLQASDSFRRGRAPAKQGPASLEAQKKWSRSSSGPSRVVPVSSPVFDPLACFDSDAPVVRGRGRTHVLRPTSPILPMDHVRSLTSVAEGLERPELPDSSLASHTPAPPPVFHEPPGLQQLEILADPSRVEGEPTSGAFRFSTVLGSVAMGSVDRLWAARDEQRVNGSGQGSDIGGKPEAAALADGASLSCYQRCLSRSSRAVFCIFGILPMRKGRAGYLYPAVVQLAISAIAAYPLFLARSDSARPSLLSWYNNAIGCLGVVMALCSLHWKRIQILLGPDRNPLKSYASEHGFHGHWVSTLPFDFLVAIMFLAFEFARRAIFLYLLRTRAPDCISDESSSYQLGQAVGALTFAVVMFFKMHVVSCLDLMIDDFSRKYAEHGLAQEGVLQWNLLQSTMNQAAKRLEGSFMILFAATCAGFAAVAADLMLGSVHELAPGALPGCEGEHLIWVLEPLQ
ncbi:unnamed protein product, partial [Polarella glacialis]